MSQGVAASALAEYRQCLSHFRLVVRRQSFALQRMWLREDGTIRVMGTEWTDREGDRLDAIEKRIREAVPSGAWFDAVWRRDVMFPPQDNFDATQAALVIDQWKAEGRISGRMQVRCHVLLNAGVDPVQIIGRWAARGRMRPAKCAVRYGARFYVDGQPTTGQYTRRFTPVQSIGFNDGSEDRYDRMTPSEAYFCTDEASVTAKQFRTIGLYKLRDQRDSDRDKKARDRLEREKLKAIKAKHGIEDEEIDVPETIDDEEIDVDCTDVVGGE